MANTAVNLTSLDFDQLKLSLIDYLRTQSKFQDIDFEGSNINVLVDLLAYNTYLNTFYTNMIGSEMFLDSAQKRNSVVSHAKALNYVPRSFRSASARVDLVIQPTTTANSVVISKGTSFTAKVGSNNFTFSVPDTKILTSTNNTFTAANVAIYEGQYVSDAFIMDYSTTQRFVLSSEAIDTDSISVTVKEDAGTTSVEYLVSSSLFGLTSTSKACFLQAAENQKYEILFGDGRIGRRPQNGSTIIVEYRVSAGELGNGASVFSVDSTIDGHSNITVSTVSAASGGQINEDVESIRFNAPRYFQTQERAVTVSDYKALLFSRFPEITAVSVFGGEAASPPRYGKVFVSVDVADADGVPDFKKNEYLQYVRERCSLSLDPIFIDPQFLYIRVGTNVRYNALVTTFTQQDIETLVKTAVINYSEQNLNDFNVTIRGSNVSRAIDLADSSILSNDLVLNPYILIVPTTGVSYRRELLFGNELRRRTLSASPSLASEQAVYTSTFTYRGTERARLLDNGLGSLQVVYITSTAITVLQENVGTVDYTTGSINLTNFTVDAYDGNGIKIFIRPLTGDIVATNNLVMRIDPADIVIQTTPERI